MEYHLSEIVKYAVNCEGCDEGTGNHAKQETANKAAKEKGFIAIATPEDGIINLCPKCVPPDVAKFFVTAHDVGLAAPGPLDEAKAGEKQSGELFDKGGEE